MYFDHFKSFLLYLYSGTITLTPSNLFSLNHLADYYNQPLLVEQSQKELEKLIAVDSVIPLWVSAENLVQTEASDKCLKFVQKNTLNVLKLNVEREMTFSILMKILCSNELSIEETDLFRFVVRWVNGNEPTEGMISELMSCVRFPLIPVKDLVHDVRSSNLVSDSLRLEAFEFQTDPSVYSESEEKKFQRRGQPSSKWIWNTELSKKDITLKGDTATWNGPGVALLSQGLKQGVEYCWTFEIISLGTCVSFGVATSNCDVSEWHSFGFDTHGWGWGHAGANFSHAARKCGNTAFEQIISGSKIKVCLTKEQHLRFFHNNILIGQHPHNPQGDLFPAVACGGASSIRLFYE